VIADHGINEAGQGIKISDIERADIKLRGYTCSGCGLVESLATAEIAHGGDNAESRLGQFDAGEQSEAAGGTGDERDFLRHGVSPQRL
jgi:hypothetical protein